MGAPEEETANKNALDQAEVDRELESLSKLPRQEAIDGLLALEKKGAC